MVAAKEKNSLASGLLAPGRGPENSRLGLCAPTRTLAPGETGSKSSLSSGLWGPPVENGGRTHTCRKVSYGPGKGLGRGAGAGRETRFVWDGMRMIAEETAAGETKARTVWGRGWEVCKRTDLTRGGDEGHDIFFHEDGKGWIETVSRENGNVGERYRYSAYGKVTFLDKDGEVRERQTVPNPWLYHGYFRDEETGHYYTVHRYLDPDQGRWLSRDPLGYHDAMGLYEFVGGNPQSLADHSGLQEDPISRLWRAIERLMGKPDPEEHLPAPQSPVGKSLIKKLATDEVIRRAPAAAQAMLVGVNDPRRFSFQCCCSVLDEIAEVRWILGQLAVMKATGKSMKEIGIGTRATPTGYRSAKAKAADPCIQAVDNQIESNWAWTGLGIMRAFYFWAVEGGKDRLGPDIYRSLAAAETPRMTLKLNLLLEMQEVCKKQFPELEKLCAGSK